MEGKERAKEGEECSRGQPPNYISRHGVISKEKYIEIQKCKSPDAKYRCDNLRKDAMKE